MEKAHDVLIRNLSEHTALTGEDLDEIRALTFTQRDVAPNEDFIRQGDEPEHSALVVSGMVARYHLLGSGGRQYLAFHISGDLPDSQGLFIDQMDHGLSALGHASVAFIPHRELFTAFRRRPTFALSVWRETLLDASIFREAITNNSARPMQARMAHLFCELFYRARAAQLIRGNRFRLPISLVQLGETLGMAIATVNRTLADLRRGGAMDLRDGELIVLKWRELQRLGDFSPAYLHLKRQSPPET
ncbi:MULTISPECIES: Crp/Fnr family transcriptional regulator [Bradyrhizobium]|uniref:CRP-like cAMP-binding protein n=1 Tax=Bradyrhizobium ottawaense TaxID=931866 RepID=A0A2U8PGQ9_9BRAD|nr:MULTISPECIES: Crp/Fnr family transcriptional regulator [Bradyrhizobium]AWL96507.1 Crp/Fnr family transcriptional regulator [Bradyrhizobium ottawaense]MBR1288400.1 Crp/Fnr family transcriptional regulator [Bradyrhizobium ottawaense]MBR1328073.1 Crp/Fnr family transcriptional regulator [Bradyrhizobium ottawaense]MBR1334158.1 Crp/Fnr family transcriptional regulator [Bradyrhizobium ottawaense]MBR1363770.1 Crp/Fnr family transcriptional regulator [Bradyrhizobium ottawaense]